MANPPWFQIHAPPGSSSPYRAETAPNPWLFWDDMDLQRDVQGGPPPLTDARVCLRKRERTIGEERQLLGVAKSSCPCPYDD